MRRWKINSTQLTQCTASQEYQTEISEVLSLANIGGIEARLKNSRKYAGRFRGLIADLCEKFEIPDPEQVDPVTRLVSGFLMWEASSLRADEALRKINDTFVDHNELRACLPGELVEMIGRRYPIAQERCERLIASLNSIYQRQDQLTLDHLNACNENNVKAYLRSLDGMTPYVFGQIALLNFNIPVLPVDRQLREALAEDEIIDQRLNETDLQLWYSEKISPDGCQTVIDAHFLLQGWVEDRRTA